MSNSGTTTLICVLAGGLLYGCADAGDRGLGPACESGLSAAQRELSAAKASGVGGAVAWSKAASLIAAGRTQQQFGEYENCTLKARDARRIVSEMK